MPSVLFDQFCDTLRSAMEHNRMTGQDLARKSGVHWVTISRILNRAVDNTSFEVAEKLLSAAGATARITLEKKRSKSA